MRSTDPERSPQRERARSGLLRARVVLLAFAAAAAAVVVALTVGGPSRSPANRGEAALNANPNLDPGTRLSGAAPTFTLTDQFGRAVSVRSLRGRVVLLAFIDSRCTSACPQTTATMLAARRLLPAGSAVELLAVNTNPAARATSWVAAYSRTHGAMHAWRFLTGSASELEQVWHAYHIEVSVTDGRVDQTPALYVIDGRGRLAALYATSPSYAAVAQQAQVVAQEIARLLPGHPKVGQRLSYAERADPGPSTAATLPSVGGGTVRIGPDGSPRLYVFFSSWLSETINLQGDLEALAGYASIAAARHLPQLTVIDEASVEPDSGALPALLGRLHPKLPYAVAVDRTGRVADGYLVQDEPWFALADASGRTLWYWDAGIEGWPSKSALIRHVRDALSAPAAIRPPTPQQQRALLADSPAPLARLHRQADKLLGSARPLEARIQSLRGYPIVINAWASWCQPCKQEYPLFAQASTRFGRQVAFLGVNTLDYGASYARAFLSAHPVSYPSYQSADGALPGVGTVLGLPTTIYIDRSGRVIKTITGVYDSLGALEGDIQHYLGL
ncbi:MAG TPA: redoxin domain-containing protein [Solirubrobacteraceae bacterium]|jgi:cytochrome oxidase Cu insertion factor (SCO1/SenC/PrrC family)/thiol-disulfide isomerase/thioredoxin|nr:redoxin domain-containing protein [Solirubrobacteraceae bacterium]